jgi:cellulose synthase/poly-beta-1,6-N-acetylglucosamine synthase-like glycosyltransferase
MVLHIVAYILLGAYFACLLLLSLFSFHRYIMLFLFYRHRPRYRVLPNSGDLRYRVTIQLPMFNERYVAERLLQSISCIEYPRELLQIQILDDSTDDTVELTRIWENRLREQGFTVERICRINRTGYKAGALENGLRTATGDYVAIFDADFVVPPDFLQKVLPYFSSRKVGMVQVRWDHLNRGSSLLTELQSIMLDGHFAIESAARNRAGRFFNFNGTAGIWRKTAILDSGGWQHDTLTEDLDLSYRAQLNGWEFIFLSRHVCPAELPSEINALKTQQHRWTKGSVQTAIKLLPQVWRSNFGLHIKIEATFHLANSFAYIFMFFLSLLMYPVIRVREEQLVQVPMWIDLVLFMSAISSICGFYLASQREVLNGWKRQVSLIPFMMSLGIGLCVNNAKAVVEAICGWRNEFVRTPKYGTCSSTEPSAKGYLSPATFVALFELLFAGYYLFIVYHCIQTRNMLTLPFMLLFLCGFLYVGGYSIVPLFRRSSSFGRIPEIDEPNALLRG